MDENMMSVRCAIEHCNTRVHGDVRCSRHSGDPEYEWTESDWGDVDYKSREQRQSTGHPTAAKGQPS